MSNDLVEVYMFHLPFNDGTFKTIHVIAQDVPVFRAWLEEFSGCATIPCNMTGKFPEAVKAVDAS